MNQAIRPLTPEERKYTQVQSAQLLSQTGCIGHLRGKMEEDGHHLSVRWTDHLRSLRTPEFEAERSRLLREMREPGGFLRDLTALENYCKANPESSLGNGGSGIRVDTEKYAYLLRLDPRPGGEHLSGCCYRRDWLDHHLRRAENGIRFIDSSYRELFRIPDGDRIRITRPDGSTMDLTCRYIDETHMEVGNGWNSLYHICQFAELMERNGNEVVPLHTSLPERCFSAQENLLRPRHRERGDAR
jgi:hypothetical protein